MGTEQLQHYLDEHGLKEFKLWCYSLSEKHDPFCLLDSCQLNTGVYGGRFELLLALGAEQVVRNFSRESLRKWKGDWLFGVMAYDLKNHFEELSSENPDPMDLPEVDFFVPQVVLSVDKFHQITLHKGELDLIPEKVSRNPSLGKGLARKTGISRETYVDHVNGIRELIVEGEVYELNYCVQHACTFDQFDPMEFQLRLLERSPVPMASFYRSGDLSLCGASMERFMMRKGRIPDHSAHQGNDRKRRYCGTGSVVDV